MVRVSLILLLGLFLSSFKAWAMLSGEDSVRRPLPLGVLQTVLGSACNAVPATSQSLPCHPADLSLEESTQFVGNFYLGEDYRRANKYRMDLKHERKIELVEDLVNGKPTLRAQSQAALWAKTRKYSLSLVPMHINYASRTRNHVYPMVDLHVAQERSLQGQFGHNFEGEAGQLLLGAQLRLVDRKYIHQDFELFEVIAQPEVLQIHREKNLYFEPGFIWVGDQSLRPRVAVHLLNWGIPLESSQNKKSPYKGASVQTGFGISPPIHVGKLNLGVNLNFAENEWSNRVRWALTYGLGLVQTVFAYSEKDYAVGIFSHFHSLRVGVAYREAELSSNYGSAVKDNSTYLEFGFVF